MNVRVTQEVYASLPSSLRVRMERAVPIEVVVLGRDAEDAASHLQALGYPSLAARLTEALEASVEALIATE